ncbi:hypothetical protein [Propionicimonas sp.]|uniref:hypothetical protein n=1 Tax=Propionicimonas sp. TaxID=1955623 RepID=UPI0039E65FD0
MTEHCAYADLSKPDRHALRDTLATAFPVGKSAHQLWSDFPDTTAFLRRARDQPEERAPQGVIGGAIVMGYPEGQYDYLAYLAIRPEFRRRGGLLHRSAVRPHHGTALLHDLYDVMRRRITPALSQQHLMIEPASEAALRFYLSALPVNEYPLKYYEPDRMILVAYDGLAL